MQQRIWWFNKNKVIFISLISFQWHDIYISWGVNEQAKKMQHRYTNSVRTIRKKKVSKQENLREEREEYLCENRLRKFCCSDGMQIAYNTIYIFRSIIWTLYQYTSCIKFLSMAYSYTYLPFMYPETFEQHISTYGTPFVIVIECHRLPWQN